MSSIVSAPIAGLGASERGWILPTGEFVASQVTRVDDTAEGHVVVEVTARLCDKAGATLAAGGAPVVVAPSRHTITHDAAAATPTALLDWAEQRHQEAAILVTGRREVLTQLATLFPVAPAPPAQ